MRRKLPEVTPLLRSGPGRSTAPAALAATAVFLAGGGLIIWSGAIHLELWNSGYQDIGTIGNLFLAQFACGLALGVVIVAVRQLWAATLGIGFALATAAGFVLSVQVGLFGYTDSWDAPFAVQAFSIEVAAAASLALAGGLCLRMPRGERVAHTSALRRGRNSGATARRDA